MPAAAQPAGPRVLLIGPVPPPIGGMSAAVADLLRSEVSRLVCLRHLHPDLVGKYGTTGMLRRALNPINGTLLCLALAWRLVQWRPRIVHLVSASGTGFFEKTLLALLARLTGRRTVLHLHGGAFGSFYDQLPSPLQLLARCGLSRNHRILALSTEMQQLLTGIGVPDHKITIVENAVFVPAATIWQQQRTQQPPDQQPDQQPLTVLLLNRLLNQKGVPELLAAADALRNHQPRLRFRLVGPESPDCAAFRDRIAALQLGDQVALPGPVSGAQKDAAYLDADIFVLPSHVEAMPIALLEAMSFGLPCITTPVGGVPSVISHGDNGLLIPVRDSAALAEAIATLASDPALRRRLGAAARAAVEQRFSWHARSAQLVSLYRELDAAGG